MFQKKVIVHDKQQELITRFNRYLGMANVSPATRNTYVSATRSIASKGELLSASKEWLEDTILLNTSLQPASKKNYILALRKFYGWLRESGIRADNPAGLLKIPRIRNGKPRYLKEHEIHSIFQAVRSVRNKLIIHLLYYCGLRAKELLGLSRRDLDLENRIVSINHGKGDKYREVPFPASMVPLLDKYFIKYHITDHLFFSSQDKALPMSYEALKCCFKSLGKRLGFHISAHRFRHSFATFLYNQGCDADTLQAFMGHSDFDTTKKYLYVMATTRRRIYDDCNLQDKVG